MNTRTRQKIKSELRRENPDVMATVRIDGLDGKKIVFVPRGEDRNGKPTFDGTSRDLANAYLKCACMAVFGVKNGWPDVGEKNIQHHRCWAVYAAIRYALAWHDHPEGGDTVDFGEPLGYGEPLPKCEVKEDV